MLDEEKRRRKAAKIIAVLGHFLGRDKDVLAGLTVADVGLLGRVHRRRARRGGRKQRSASTSTCRGCARRPSGSASGWSSSAPTAPRCPSPTARSTCWSSTTSTSTWSTPTRSWPRCAGCSPTTASSTWGWATGSGVMEPHYKLPFLSYLPPALADRYVRRPAAPTTTTSASAPGAGCAGWLRGLHVWDYTFPVLATPARVRRVRAASPGRWGGWRGGCWPARPAPCCGCCCRSCRPTCGWRPRATAARPGAALPQPPEPVRPL